MIKDKEIITSSSEETEKLGESFAKDLKSGDIVCLYGELGGGKTTFTKGLARGLGIKKRIISPTFILVRQHKVSIKYNVSSIKYLFHIDLYRLENEKDIKSLGFEDLFNTKDSIIVIEWPEKLGNIIPKNRIDVHFEVKSENERKIVIKKIKNQSVKIKS